MKKRYKFLLGIVGVFIIINIAWYAKVKSTYGPYLEKVPKNSLGLNYKKDDDGYHYNVSKPSYLSLEGNLAVTEKDDKYGIIIWPSATKKNSYKYGVTIVKDEFMNIVEVDEELNPLDNYSEEVVELVSKSKYDLTILFNKANELWGISG